MKAPGNDERGQTPDKLSGKTLIRPLAKIQVLIVHQACWIRRAMRSLIDGSGRFAVCAETDNARSAITLFEQHQPKIVVLGMALPRGDGLHLIKTLLKLAPPALILVLSWDGSVVSVGRALRAGAVGYLTVEDGDLELPIALDTIVAGTCYISKSLWNIVLKSFARGVLGRANGETNLLTDRELEIFTLIGRGAGILEIAKELGVSVKTVETHQMRLKQKLNLVSAMELRKHAMRSVSEPTQGSMNRRR
ncbi:MAG TPA: response regulator transcription factor [Candidatus Udaeobacter sp.]|nr:response regulator transcription factor [Candidatus Udaeobacter sp.]